MTIAAMTQQLPRSNHAVAAYLDLMQRCLLNTIYEDAPMDYWSGGRFRAERRATGRDWPSQAHTMMDVGYQASNMWFAAQKKNWPLARFYFNETRQHIQWTVRVRPERKDADGKPVDLKAIFEAIDSSALAAVKSSIEKKDAKEFDSSYRHLLEACYSCHKASSMPFLRPMIPAGPAQSIINTDPDATWPE